ncbi:MAG: LUD domain-containing protein [Candidatus Diapherotrites archaeon]|nr:LUD domain-containing protein [Candidatus Diapherotrites archaeon]
MHWDQLADETELNQTVNALKSHGMDCRVAENARAAREQVLSLIPAGSEVMTMTSRTLEATGLNAALNEPPFVSVRAKIMALDKQTQGTELKRLGCAPMVAVGSVHAITRSGQVVVVAQSGSQLPAYAYGAAKVIWVVGSQKIVSDLDAAFKRITEYCLPLESERAKKAYGVSSAVNKMLVISQETVPGRITLVFVKEKLGF